MKPRFQKADKYIQDYQQEVFTSFDETYIKCSFPEKVNKLAYYKFPVWDYCPKKRTENHLG